LPRCYPAAGSSSSFRVASSRLASTKCTDGVPGRRQGPAPGDRLDDVDRDALPRPPAASHARGAAELATTEVGSAFAEGCGQARCWPMGSTEPASETRDDPARAPAAVALDATARQSLLAKTTRAWPAASRRISTSP
jgi:hypothetical protein